MGRIKHGMSIDLEEWFTVYNFHNIFKIDEWDSLELRCEVATLKLLTIFDEQKIKATFFVLGWVAERLPDLIIEIERRGHEIASHGYSHTLVKEIGEEAFKLDLDRSLTAINGAVKTNIIGYRAPSFSIDLDKDWIFRTLKQFGFKYDSSIFPTSFHPDYANGDAPLTPFLHSHGITEFPMTCVKVGRYNLPCSGGGYFRLLPYKWFDYGFKKCEKEGRSAMFYLHPWELDPYQPRVKDVSLIKQFRHYYNQKKSLIRLNKLTRDFEFTTVRNILGL